VKKRVISLCDRTGNMVLPWAEAGYECICVDTQHPSGGATVGQHPNIWLFNRDVLTLKPEFVADAYAVFAFPPCTDMSVSGARWFKSKGMDAIIHALQVVNACRKIAEASGGRYMIENPISTLSTYWRDPDYRFDPCDFGGYKGGQDDDYTKRTCLWTGGGFVMPTPKPVSPNQGSKMHLLPPSANRGDLRSETPKGFAQAVFEANHAR
jgi:hypothetical protein